MSFMHSNCCRSAPTSSRRTKPPSAAESSHLVKTPRMLRPEFGSGNSWNDPNVTPPAPRHLRPLSTFTAITGALHRLPEARRQPPTTFFSPMLSTLIMNLKIVWRGRNWTTRCSHQPRRRVLDTLVSTPADSIFQVAHRPADHCNPATLQPVTVALGFNHPPPVTLPTPVPGAKAPTSAGSGRCFIRQKRSQLVSTPFPVTGFDRIGLLRTNFQRPR